MRGAFYPFVSGPQPQIDPQLVQQAIDAWSWYWIGIEATYVFIVTGLVLIAGSAYQVGFQTIGLTILVAAMGIPAMRAQCERYAVAQVRAIVSDTARAAVARSAFDELRGIRIVYRWGGAFSVTADSTPLGGTLHDGAVAYSVGCTGHGVAMTHMNGRILRDLVLGRSTELTDLWFVNRRAMPLPPEPIRSIGAKAVTSAMALDDWWCDRAQTS